MTQTGTRSAPDSTSCGPSTRRPRDQSARDQLIVHYSPLVKYVAGRVAARLPSHVDDADLVSYGIFGLIDAIERFDPSGRSSSRPTPYPGSGAIIDELRSIDWVPRSVRAKARAVEQAFSKLEGTARPDAHRRRGGRRART